MRECLSEAEHGGGDDDGEEAAADGHAPDGALLRHGPLQSLKARWKKFDRGVLKGMFRYQPPPLPSSAAQHDPSRAESQMSLNGGASGAGGNPGAADIFLRVRQQCNDPFFSSEVPLERGGRARFRRPASHAEQPSESAAAQRRSSTLRQTAASFGGGGLGQQQRDGRVSSLQASGGAASEFGAGEGIADLRQSLLDSHAALAVRTLPASTDHHDDGAEQSEAL
jgi:hypothetical protein